MAKKIILFLAIDYQVIMRIYSLVFILVEEEVVVAGVVGPDVFDAFVDLAFIFDLLEILYYLHRSPGTCRKVDKLFFSCGPWCVLKFGREF